MRKIMSAVAIFFGLSFLSAASVYASTEETHEKTSEHANGDVMTDEKCDPQAKGEEGEKCKGLKAEHEKAQAHKQEHKEGEKKM